MTSNSSTMWTRLVRRRLPEGMTGLTQLHELIADHLPDDAEPADVVVGIETDRGPWVQALIAAGYTVYAVNPLQAARYRERHGVAGAKSDPGDAHVLAELVRVDRAHHRPVAGDSDIAEEVKVLARTHQNLIWSRQRQQNALRSMLREFYPAALVAFGDELAGRDALAVLAAAPDPARGAKLTPARAVDAAAQGRPATQPADRGRADREPRCAPSSWPPGRLWSARTRPACRPWSPCSPPCRRRSRSLGEQVGAGFGRHPDVEIYLQPTRPRSTSSVPGCSPSSETIPSATPTPEHGRTTPAWHRSPGRPGRAASYWPASNATCGSPTRFTSKRSARSPNPPAPARYYDQHRTRGNTHHQALRALGNRLVGILARLPPAPPALQRRRRLGQHQTPVAA